MPSPEETAVLIAARDWADAMQELAKMEGLPDEEGAFQEEMAGLELALLTAVNAWRPKKRRPANTNSGPAGLH